MRFLVLLFLTTGCALPFQPYTTDRIDPEVEPYLQDYLEEKETHTGNSSLDYDINIVLGDVDGNRAGVCRYTPLWKSKKRYIVLNSNYWNRATEAQRALLVLHELGHCDLDIHYHLSDSIMQPNIWNTEKFLENEEEYLREFFNKYKRESK